MAEKRRALETQIEDRDRDIAALRSRASQAEESARAAYDRDINDLKEALKLAVGESDAAKKITADVRLLLEERTKELASALARISEIEKETDHLRSVSKKNPLRGLSGTDQRALSIILDQLNNHFPEPVSLNSHQQLLNDTFQDDSARQAFLDRVRRLNLFEIISIQDGKKAVQLTTDGLIFMRPVK